MALLRMSEQTQVWFVNTPLILILFLTFLVLVISAIFFLYKAALIGAGSLGSFWLMQAAGDQSCPAPHLAKASTYPSL